MSISEMCRACLVQMESFTYYLLDNVPSEIYSFCTTIEIKQEDSLPRALCNVCYDLLTKFYDFKQRCIQSQNTLLSCDIIKTELQPSYEVHVHSKDIKSEATCINFDTFGDNTVSHNYLNSTNNTKQEVDSKDLVEIDNPPCSDDNIGDVQGFAHETSVKQEHVNVPIDFDTDYQHLKQLRHEPVINSIKKTRKRKSKNRKAKLIEPREYFSCGLCEKIFYSSTKYNFHKSTHNRKELSIKCTACTKTFMTMSGLRRHLQNSHTSVNLKALKCEICGKISKTKDSLKMHLKIHVERKLLVCDTCGKSYTTTYSLKTHLETHKENREKSFTCEHCGKKFYTNSRLVSHVSRQHSDRRYICDICSYPFMAKTSLAKHLLIHEGKKLYKCDICHKLFGAKSSLVEHGRTHSGERPFECNFCPKSFVSRRRLRDHHRIHTGEKPYKCDLCDQAFIQCGTLNRHLKVHERDGPVV